VVGATVVGAYEEFTINQSTGRVEIMKNIQVAVKGSILTLTVDLSKTQGQSASGKSTMIATTEGNQKVTKFGGKDVSLGLNLYTKA